MPKLNKAERVIKWSDDEVFRLLKANPKMSQCTKNGELADAIVAAQKRNALPKDRQRERSGLVQTLGRADHGASPLKEQLAKALVRYQEELAAKKQSEPEAPPRATNAGQHVVRWHINEWTRLAHDEEVKALLALPEQAGDRELCNVLMRAQRRQLPRERQRLDKSLYTTMRSRNDGKNKARGAWDTLREAIKYQPKEPIVSIHAPLSEYRCEEEVFAEQRGAQENIDEQQGAQENTSQAVESAPAPTPCLTFKRRAAAAGGLGGAIASLIAVAIDKLRTGIVESVNAGIDQALSTALADATVQLRDMNAQTIASILGGEPAAQQSVPAVPKHEPKARGMRVDIVGLLNGQVEQVKKAAGAGFDLRFFTPEELDRSELTAPIAIMLANQVPHRSRHQIQSRGGRLVWANGGVSGLLRELNALAH